MDISSYFALFDDTGRLKAIPTTEEEVLHSLDSMASFPAVVVGAYIDYLLDNYSSLITSRVVHYLQKHLEHSDEVKLKQGSFIPVPINHRIFKRPEPLYGRYSLYNTPSAISSEAMVLAALRQDNFSFSNPYSRRGFLSALLNHEKSTIKLLDVADLNQFIMSVRGADGRYQIIVDTGGHFATVDIKVESGTLQGIILDAANNETMNDLKTILELHHCKDIYMPLARKMPNGSTETIQRDDGSCPVFAYDHAKQLALMGNPYALMDNICEAPGVIYFDRLPPELVRTTQSMTFLDKYWQMPVNRSLYESRLSSMKDEVLTHTVPFVLSAHDKVKGYYYVKKNQNRWITDLINELIGTMQYAVKKSEIETLLATYTTDEAQHLRHLTRSGQFSESYSFDHSKEKLIVAIERYHKFYTTVRAELVKALGEKLNPLHLEFFDNRVQKAGNDYALQSVYSSIALYRKYVALKEKLAPYEGSTVHLEFFDCAMLDPKSMSGFRPSDDEVLYLINTMEAYEALYLAKNKLFTLSIPDEARSYWNGLLLIPRCLVSYERYLREVKAYTAHFEELAAIIKKTKSFEHSSPLLDEFIIQKKRALHELHLSWFEVPCHWDNPAVINNFLHQFKEELATQCALIAPQPVIESVETIKDEEPKKPSEDEGAKAPIKVDNPPVDEPLSASTRFFAKPDESLTKDENIPDTDLLIMSNHYFGPQMHALGGLAQVYLEQRHQAYWLQDYACQWFGVFLNCFGVRNEQQARSNYLFELKNTMNEYAAKPSHEHYLAVQTKIDKGKTEFSPRAALGQPTYQKSLHALLSALDNELSSHLKAAASPNP